MIKHTEKCRKHSPAACVFYISLVFPNARHVLSQCNTRLRLLYLLSDEEHEKMKQKNDPNHPEDGFKPQQILDEIEHDIMNYQNRGLCYLPKPKAEAENTDTRF